MHQAACQHINHCPQLSICISSKSSSALPRPRQILTASPLNANALLTIYQRYYRDVFYLCIGKEEAAGHLRAGLAETLGIGDESIELDELEQKSQGFPSLRYRPSQRRCTLRVMGK